MSPEFDEWSLPNRAVPLGSPAYYAARFSPEPQRRRNALLLTWHALIRDIGAQAHDPGVARLKLGWWRNELAMLSDGSPSHPLATALANERLDDRALGQMTDIVDAIERSVGAPKPADDHAFADTCRRDEGTLFKLFAAIEPAGGYDTALCIEAGGYCGVIERIRQLATDPRLLPADLHPDALSTLSAAQRVSRLESLIAQFDAPRAGQRSQLPAVPRKLAAMAAAMHGKMRRRHYPVTDMPLDRPPIAHLWTAWRCR